jgi:hypothetical protein
MWTKVVADEYFDRRVPRTTVRAEKECRGVTCEHSASGRDEQVRRAGANDGFPGERDRDVDVREDPHEPGPRSSFLVTTPAATAVEPRKGPVITA